MVPSTYVAIGNMPLSTTGKIDRRRLRDFRLTFLQQDPKPSLIDHGRLSTPPNKSEELLLRLWSEILNIPPETIALDDSSFISLGGDSISAMQLVSRARRRGLLITVPHVLHAQDLRGLARKSRPVSSRLTSATPKMQYLDTATAWPLSPIQHLFFAINPAGPNQFNQSVLLRLRSRIPLIKIAGAVHTIVARHEMLRARFHQTGPQGGWEQSIEPLGQSLEVFAFHDHTVTNRHEMACVVMSAQEALDIRRGPIFAVDVVSIPGEDSSLLFTAHHLAIDIVSWQIIVDDMRQLFDSGSLPSQRPNSYRASCLLDMELGEHALPDHVQSYLYASSATSFPYWSVNLDTNTYGNASTCELHFNGPVTSLLLRQSNNAYNTTPIDILLGTLVHNFSCHFPDRPSPVVFVESHGRTMSNDSEQDFTETIGWLTTLQPIYINLDSSPTVFDAIKLSKDCRKSMEGIERNYFARHTSAEKDHGILEMLLNFSGSAQQLGDSNGLFTIEDRPHLLVPSANVQSDARRFAVISIDADIRDGQLNVLFTFNKATKHYKRLQDWVASFESSLETTVLGLKDQSFSPTLSDFPLLSITYNGLGHLLQDLCDERQINPASIKDIYCTTPMQEGIILSTRKGSASYANSVIWQCLTQETETIVSAERLAQAWRIVFGRHSILSTVFDQHPDTGRLLQIVLDNVRPKINVQTTSSSDPTIDLRSYEQQLHKDSFEPTFSICHSPRGELACRLDLSHAMSDAISFEILGKELIQAYSETALPPAPPFSALVASLTEKSQSSATSYWKTRAKNVVPSLLPGDKHRSGVASHGTIPVALDQSERVNSFCKHRGITRSVFVQIAYALVLSQNMHSSRVCFGYLASGRDAPIDNIENLVGPLISMLVADIDLAQPAETIFKSVQDQTIEDLSRQHVSLAEIMHDTSLDATQLFNTSVTVRMQSQLATDTNGGLSLEVVFANDPHEYDLVLGAGLSGDATELAFSFRKDVLFDSTVQGYAHNLILAIELLLSGEDQETTLYNRFTQTLQSSSTAKSLSKINGSPRPQGHARDTTSSALLSRTTRHFEQRPRTRNEAVLQACCTEVLGIQDSTEINMDCSFLENGADSIQAMQLVAVLRKRYA